MKKLFLLLPLLLLVSFACQSSGGGEMANPFFTEFETPFGTPPFDKIKDEHYKPALL